MNFRERASILLTFTTILFLFASCAGTKSTSTKKTGMPTIDLSHWKVTIPTPREDGSGKPLEISPPEILNYHKVKALEKFMYPDTSDASIVFYTYPASSTANSKYSRSELREQMTPGRNDLNWKFKDGAYMKVTMSVPEVTEDKKGRGHRVIIAQIHGKLSKEQQKLIGQKDTNAPPILKVYYRDGKVQVKTKKYSKKVKSVEEMIASAKKGTTLEEILVTKNWVDAEGHYFNRIVGNKKFTLEVIVSDGRLEVVLDGKENVVYENESMKKWSVFDNYFKAGNYLTTRDRGAFAKVKIYELEVSH